MPSRADVVLLVLVFVIAVCVVFLIGLGVFVVRDTYPEHPAPYPSATAP
jgi:hypothetical protein